MKTSRNPVGDPLPTVEPPPATTKRRSPQLARFVTHIEQAERQQRQLTQLSRAASAD
ncbi:MAG: hypothetical protein KDA90_20885 [Planctomycetaceae bacterium]|nr:hypothetical protein [Planctomycetaceae bacterium]